MIDGDPVEADEIHVTVLNKALPVFYIKPVGAGAQDDGSWNTEQQARDVLERLMAASDVELPASPIPWPVRSVLPPVTPPLQVDAAVKDQILRELKVRHYGRIAAVPDWVKISSRSYGTPLSTPTGTPAGTPSPRRKQVAQSPVASPCGGGGNGGNGGGGGGGGGNGYTRRGSGGGDPIPYNPGS